MLNKISQNFSAKSCVYTILFVSVLICNIPPNVFADSVHYQGPELSETNSVQVLPTNLSEIPITVLKLLKKERKSKLELFQPIQKSLEASEKELLDSLIAYDDVRLQIAEIIIKLVDEYNVTGSYKKKLLGYCDTFNTNIKPARSNVQTLEAYKVYGTHFAVAYISLLYTFRENSAFHSKYMSDINNPKSTIGKYRRELAVTYQEVKKAQKVYESILVARKINESIMQLDKEINTRKTRLISQYSADQI